MSAQLAQRTRRFSEVAGPAGARPILFVHGTRVTRCMWLPQLHGLADEYRVLATDLPGHGALAYQRFELEAAMQQIAAVLDEEECGLALLIGSSLGGYLCLEFACRHPERAAGLVLSGCTLNLRGPIALPFRAGGGLVSRVSERRLVAIQAALCRRVLPAATAEALIDAGFYFAAVPDALQSLIGRDFRPMLRECAAPMLFLNGQRDWVFRRHEKAFAAAARHGRLQLIPRGSHRCNLEYPETFTEAVREFAREIDW